MTNTPHDGSQVWDARRIVQEIDRRMQEPEIKERGFPSFYLEAIERSINKLVATEIAKARVEERMAELHAVFVRLGAVPTSVELNDVLGYINERMEKALKEQQP